MLALAGAARRSPVGRDIEWEKVKEIYRLRLKRGMKLAAISAVNRVYTDDAIANIRELAMAKRAEMATTRSWGVR